MVERWVQSLLLTEPEIDSFCGACKAYGVAVRAYGGALTAPKEHSIEDHCPRYMRRFKTLYLLTEEGDEACHHEVKEASVQTRSMRDPLAKARATLRIFERKQSAREIRKKRRTEDPVSDSSSEEEEVAAAEAEGE
jgi:predicted metal-binding protein